MAEQQQMSKRLGWSKEGHLKIYLAARYSARGEMRLHAKQLEAMGHEVTSRWIHRTAAPYDGSNARAIEWASFAMDDTLDILQADIVIVFSNTSVAAQDTPAHGGKHAELGMAIAFGKRVALIGEPEHVFHWMPSIRRFAHWSDLVMSKWLKEGVATWIS